MDRVSFHVNGELHSVGSEVSSDVTLLDYLRTGSELRGSKYMCREGGCGACVVAAARAGHAPQAVNSCLVAVTSCAGWAVRTVEGLGGRARGYHPLQAALAEHNGSQCGHCSPGWVMAMYSLLQSKRKLTMLEVEQSFGSNVCRCTGYRPILEAFKTFASDAPEPRTLVDIEDLSICKKDGTICEKHDCTESDWCIVQTEDVEVPPNIEIKLKDDKLWFRVQFIRDIFGVLQRYGYDSYMLVAGNTGKGAYPIDDYPRILIDISEINELKGYRFDQNMVLGAGSTLTEVIDIFESVANTEGYFWYLEKLRQHLLMVAHIPVRNLATIAGNLMLKYQHRDFQSDIFLLLEAVGAYITIVDSRSKYLVVTPEAFLNIDMRGKVIQNVLLPPLSQEYRFVSFKIMPKTENAHAIVHSAYLYKLDSTGTLTKARLVYGGLSPQFVHARATERFLVRRKLFDNTTLQGAIKVLERELVVVENPPEPSVAYRKNLAVNLFYKGLLQLSPAGRVAARYASGTVTLSQARPVSSGRQFVSTNPKLYPLNEPITKVEALVQCAGEAPYTEDLPSLPREVFGAFIITTVPTGEIDSIDVGDALRHPEVVAVYTYKDIPGVNAFTPGDPKLASLSAEELFCSGPVKYNGQVIGVVVAKTRYIAEYAAKLVLVKYRNDIRPVLDVKEAKKDSNRVNMVGNNEGGDKGKDSFKVIKGNLTVYQQHFFCMETIVSITKPTEEGLEVVTTSQHLDFVQVMISKALQIPENKIDLYVRRLGGAYGEKISRSSQVAVACALVTQKLERPCRIILPLATHYKSIGKRLPCSTDYEVAVDKLGKIQYCNENMYMDNGHLVDEPLYSLVLDNYYNCYMKSRWNFKVFTVTTDTASNTWCRAPGTLEAIASVEFIMERIAYELSLDQLEVRLRNLDSDSTDLRGMVERVKTEAQYADRRAAVISFNNQNRWKKRGLRFSLMRWIPTGGQNIDVNLSVFHADGTVAMVIGGVEMGQGINTKAVQIAAFLLKIPVQKIQIKANNVFSSPNTSATLGSITSVNIGIGVQRCCEELLERLAPIKEKMVGASWEEVVKAAFEADVDLQAHGYVSKADRQKVPVFGVTLAEVEVDVLTGEWEVLRVDLLEDAGLSVSPWIDIGQVEGAFTMGLGYWTSEHFVFDSATGELLTDRTWNYYVPQARDIPRDFRIYFRNNSYSEPRLFGAKSIGEPPLCMAVAVPFAMREAIVSARLDAGLPANQWFQIDGPYTREAIQLATETKYSDYKLY